MIKNLDGIYETVDYQSGTNICLYRNQEYENYPPHWHITCEVIMPLSSTYRAVCGETEYTLREGDILIIFPGVIHELFAPPTGERIIFQPGLNGISMKELDLLVSRLSPAVLITPETYPEIHGKIHHLMNEITEEYFSSDPYTEVSILARFLAILVLLGRSTSLPGHDTWNENNIHHREYLEKFLYITDYISTHFDEDLTLEGVASMAGFSKYHFSRLFRQYTNCSFYRYLNQKRIDHAKLLLLDPKISVTEAATRSGFSSLSSFLRMFKQLSGYTPSHFREIYDGFPTKFYH